MDRKIIKTLAILSAAAVGLAATAFAGTRQGHGKIGIFDLDAIHAVPLNPEVLRKTKQGDVNIEEVRFTSLPGVRIYAILTYKDGAHAAAGYCKVERFGAKPMMLEASHNFFCMTVEPPTGNTDAKKMESVGGPKLTPGTFSIDDAYTDNPTDSYIYQYTVALIRAMDYMATRPEVNLSISVVTGYSWAGTMVALLHALDDRPAAYILFHGLGAYTDANGMSGGETAPISRKKYEMYCPAAYSQYGTKPMFVGCALDDYYTKLDAIIETYKNLKSPKAFAFVPNRHHAETSRQEMLSNIAWIQYWEFGQDKPSTIGEGTVSNSGGKMIYSCAVDTKVPLLHAEALVSYGKYGDWANRTWHRIPLVKQGDNYQAEIPIYDPALPLFVIGQIETEKFHDAANGPQFIKPGDLGVTASNATYPEMLFDPSQKDDLYLRTGDIEWSSDGPSGKGSVILTPGEEQTLTFQNIDGDLWKDKKVLDIWLKGDGKPGPITAYMVYDSNLYVEIAKLKSQPVELVPKGGTFTAGWTEYSIPLSKIPNLDQVTSLIIDSQLRKLQMGPILVK